MINCVTAAWAAGMDKEIARQLQNAKSREEKRINLRDFSLICYSLEFTIAMVTGRHDANKIKIPRMARFFNWHL